MMRVYGKGERRKDDAPSKCRRLTQRALDGGYAPRFSGIFLALSFFRFDRESTLPPTASNAHRWAAPLMRLTNDKRRACTAEQLMLE